MRTHCTRGRLFRQAPPLSQCGFLRGPDLPVDGLSDDDVPCAICHSAHVRLDRAVGRNVARPRAEDFAPAPDFSRPRPAQLRPSRPSQLVRVSAIAATLAPSYDATSRLRSVRRNNMYMARIASPTIAAIQ